MWPSQTHFHPLIKRVLSYSILCCFLADPVWSLEVEYLSETYADKDVQFVCRGLGGRSGITDAGKYRLC